MSEERPDPDELLHRIKQDEIKESRGRLKIFFGASAGVGKTYAMLSAAHAAKRMGIDVVVGIVETHGRGDTAQMLEGLDVLPRKQVEYRGNTLTEFDIDGAIARKPALILVDELAHSNVAGSRHPKRWQDVEELLVAGIDVYTSLNVQHLESLNDVVGQITQVRVYETLPDKVFDLADEVTLVDLPAEELLQRMREGKVYMAEQAERAIRNFFRKGNLIALRELALRRTADRVDAQMRQYRADQSINRVWQAKERLLVCIGPGDGSKLVRAAARLAANLRADWIVVYVETPRLQRLPEAVRQQVLDTLRQAQQAGAETQTLAGAEITPTLLSYARGRNVSKVVVARSSQPSWLRWFVPPLSQQLSMSVQDLDVYVVGKDVTEADERIPLRPGPRESMIAADDDVAVRENKRGMTWAAVSAVMATALAALLFGHVDLTNVAMVYLLAVVFVATRYGRWPGVLASFLSVAAFDFFFVPPRFSFSVTDTQYLLTFAVMLVVSITVSGLTSSMRYQAHIANYRERRTTALYDLSKELAAALTYDQILDIGLRYVESVFASRAALLLPDSAEKVRQPVIDPAREGTWPDIDLGVAQWVYDHQDMAGLGTNTLPSSKSLYLPLKAPMRTRGVLAIQPDALRQVFQPEQQRLLETFASQIALAIERVHYVEVARDALVSMESERLRNSLLSAISHDLRTPLTVIVGLASGLHPGNLDEARQQAAIEEIQDVALKMSGLVSNLLEMARLQSGSVRLFKQWQMVEEVVGSALRASHRFLGHRHIQVHLPDDLPLIELDAVLVERVLCNLLENAAKYTPEEATVDIDADVDGSELLLTVSDNGPGLVPGMEERIFEKFLRGESETDTPGVGLGLAICRAVMTAHHGRIWAENRPEGGAMFHLAFPLGQPPSLPEIAEEDGDA